MNPAPPAAELLAVLGDPRIVGRLPATFGSLSTDSRRIAPGALYVALRGERVDGHHFARAAAAEGAAAIVVENEQAVNVAQIIVPDTRRAISRLADAFFDRPSASLRVAGVTGTNGKTTTVALIAAILEAAGIVCATVGTLGAALGPARWNLANTTPPALELHELLATLRSAGATAVAMEVSSHALALDRVEDVRFEVAAFTNLSRDHLDFHGSPEAYVRAKRHLFDLAPRAVLNVDDLIGARFAREIPEAIGYALDSPAAVRAERLVLEPAGSRFSVDGTSVELPLPGRFNVYNALAAFALARTMSVDDGTIARALAAAPQIPGRMERISVDGIDALVDYAHTPDALSNILTAARETTRRKLTVVFGCGGDRDAGKRSLMGEIAVRIADRVIVTSDNPRSEDPLAIAQAIAAGGPSEIVLDRRHAIRQAIGEALAGDTVVIAGKGHERYQHVGDRVFPFDDREEVHAAFAARERTPAGG